MYLSIGDEGKATKKIIDFYKWRKYVLTILMIPLFVFIGITIANYNQILPKDQFEATMGHFNGSDAFKSIYKKDTRPKRESHNARMEYLYQMHTDGDISGLSCSLFSLCKNTVISCLIL